MQTFAATHRPGLVQAPGNRAHAERNVRSEAVAHAVPSVRPASPSSVKMSMFGSNIQSAGQMLNCRQHDKDRSFDSLRTCAVAADKSSDISVVPDITENSTKAMTGN